MKLTVVTPEKTVLEVDNIDAVFVNSVDGEVGILPRHVPLVTPLTNGVLRYEVGGKKQPVAVMSGLLQTNGQDVTVLSVSAEPVSEIDVARAKSAKERAEARLKAKEDGVDLDRAQAALARSLARLRATSLN